MRTDKQVNANEVIDMEPLYIEGIADNTQTAGEHTDSTSNTTYIEADKASLTAGETIEGQQTALTAIAETDSQTAKSSKTSRQAVRR
jgi:hypothetical protein